MTRIVATPHTLAGAPRIAKTRIGVNTILGCLHGGWDIPTILEQFPELRAQQVKACLSYAMRLVEKQRAKEK